jgi:hypothetical protein
MFQLTYARTIGLMLQQREELIQNVSFGFHFKKLLSPFGAFMIKV